MVKRTLVFLLLTGLAGIAAARTLYRIEFRGQAPVISRDAPTPNGSVLVFHRHSDGRLTGVPQEAVVRVSEVGPPSRATRTVRLRRVTDTLSVPSSPAAPMAPGDILVLGPTGEGAADREAVDQDTVVARGAASPDEIPLRPYALPIGVGSGTPLANQPGFPGGRPLASGGPFGSPFSPPTFDGAGRPIPITGGAASGNLALPPVPNPVPLSLPGSTMSPAGATPPGTTVQPAGATPPGTTVRPAGSTPQGTTVQPAGGASPRG